MNIEFSSQKAILRSIWEEKVSQMLEDSCWNRAYSPSICSMDVHQTYKKWVGDPLFTSGDRCFLPHKGIFHSELIIKSCMPTLIFELDEIHSGEDHHPGLYLTALCKLIELNDHLATIYASITNDVGIMNLHQYSIKSFPVENDFGLILAKATYTLKRSNSIKIE